MDGIKKKRKEVKSKQKRGNVCGADHSGKPEQMPVDDEKLSNATNVMGMARRKEGGERGRVGARPQRGLLPS